MLSAYLPPLRGFCLVRAKKNRSNGFIVPLVKQSFPEILGAGQLVSRLVPVAKSGQARGDYRSPIRRGHLGAMTYQSLPYV